MGSLGVCSWSLKPTSPSDLAFKVNECGLRTIQLALDPIRLDPSTWALKDTWKRLDQAGISIVSGMMVTKGEDYSTLDSIRRTGGILPDAHWEANLAAARENAEIAHQFGLEMVSFHAGFIPERADDPVRLKMVDRIVEIAECFAEHDITVALETGQETADTLRGLMDQIDHPMIGVNFDPGNMILYGTGDPVQAARDLALFIDQIHVKDAVPSNVAGEWGKETMIGRGVVRWSEFFAALAQEEVECDFLIEREDGNSRVQDVKAAVEYLDEFDIDDDSEE
ncbi:MAG: sugar phosphate isomerase/epimerase [Pyrinomonadaceae bacterium]|nr:sugar phosphate isomerase/epimerase [Phycisphaerales bacterium]